MGNTLAAPVASASSAAPTSTNASSSSSAAAAAAAEAAATAAASAAAGEGGVSTMVEPASNATAAAMMLAPPISQQTTSAEDQLLLPAELDGVFQSRLGGGRLFKTCAALVERDGRVRRVVVKTHLKRPGAPSFANYVRAVELLGNALEGAAHLVPYTLAFDAETSASLVRRRLWRSLVQRLGVRPFLAPAEKRWLAYQLLRALAESHARGARHGDIKGENIMVTSCGWLYVTDFAWFKPVQLPVNNPADFSFYFDTSAGGRRTCTLAPERFVTDVTPEAQLNDAMDIFSAGCVLAELVLDGRPLFDLSALLAYKRGEFSPRDALAGAEDEALAGLALEMVALEPERRSCGAENFIARHRGGLFPEYFDQLHECFGRLNALDADGKMRMLEADFASICTLFAEGEGDAQGMRAARALNEETREGGYEEEADAEPESEHREATMAEAESPIAARQARSLSHDLSSFSASLAATAHTHGAEGAGTGKSPLRRTSSSRVRAESVGDDDDDDDIGDGGGSDASREFGLSSLSLPERRQEENDDGLAAFIDEKEELRREEEQGGGHTRARRMTKDNKSVSLRSYSSSSSTSVAEVVVERVEEHEMRESGGDDGKTAFTPAGFENLWASRALSGATTRKKEDVSLPLEGGWVWEGEWQQGSWMYRIAGSTEWTPDAAAKSLWRRRQWTRRRVRHAHGFGTSASGVSTRDMSTGGGGGERDWRQKPGAATATTPMSMATEHLRLSPDGMCLVSTVVCSVSRGARLRQSRCRYEKEKR